MLFLNPWLLLGLVGVLVPIILHLVRKQAAKPYDWGAMHFLFETVVARKRTIEWEDVLLMSARCLLVALIALAIARPYVPPDSQVPWMVLLPMVLVGVVCFGAAFVVSARKWQLILGGVGLLMMIGAGSLVWLEKYLNLQRFQTSGRRDVALVIDGSTSMKMSAGGASLFEKAVEEARTLVKEAPRGTAFSVVLGGPAPELKTTNPLSRRSDVLEVLDSLEPVGGPFRAHEALGLATVSLASGRGSTKDLLVLGDGQRIGWKMEEADSWKGLGQVWQELESRPRLLLRAFAAAENLRNISITGIELSREVVGCDRPVIVRVSLKNTGTEVVTPGPLTLSPGDLKEITKGVGQLMPGEETIVEFEVTFIKAGAQVLKAEVEGKDDLSDDDLSERVLQVRQSLQVLLVEGNAEADFFERATSYLGLALSPGTSSGLIDARIVLPADLAREPFPKGGVVVLGDVPDLPKKSRTLLKRFVRGGGGLLVLAGERTGKEGLPAELGEMTPLEAVIDSTSFDHPALRGLGEVGLGNVGLSAFREVGALSEGAQVAARFANGEPFLISQSQGQGRVILSTCGWDSRLGNLPASPGFVPLAHELVSWLAGGSDLDLNVEASWSPSILLGGGSGLRGEYFVKDGESWRKVLDRVDPVIDFDWKREGIAGGASRDQFRVTWRGQLVPPVSGRYELGGQADDSLMVIFDGKEIFSSKYQRDGSAKMKLKAGRTYAIEARFREDYELASARLWWKRPDRSGAKEIIPASALMPFSREEKQAVIGLSSATDPLGNQREVRGIQGAKGRKIELKGAAIPGVYQVGVPSQMALKEKRLPLVVQREVEESRFDRFNEDDKNLIRREIDLIEVSSTNDILAVFRGEGFGRELGGLLVMAALVMFFVERLLGRWVSKSRHVGEDVSVDFEHRDEVSESFLKAAQEVKR